MYTAKIDIGDFKKGDVIPDSKAEVWMKMYVDSPVIFHPGGADTVAEEEPSAEEPVEEESEVPSWMDDYLARNSKVVVKNIKGDDFSDEDYASLDSLERASKNRSAVLKAIKKKVASLEE